MNTIIRYKGNWLFVKWNICDFVCWTPHGIHIERILPDTLFETVKPALVTFFVRVLLPLLMTGKTQREQGTAHVSEKEDTIAGAMAKTKVQW